MKSGRNWGRLGMTFNIKQVQLKDLLLEPIRNGLTKPKAIRGRGVPMIAMGEIFANNRIFSFPMERVPVTDKELSSSSIYEGDLLFARQSLVLEGAGKCCIVKEVNEPTVFESHLIRVRLDNSKALPDYIYYYFNSYQGKENIKTIVEQVAAAGIRGRDLVNLYIPIPPITVQQQILQVLMSIDDKIAINTTINENLEQQAQAFFTDLFITNAKLEWKTGTVSDLGDVVGGGTPSKKVEEYYTNDGIAWITPKDLSNDKSKFITHGETDITDLGLAKSGATLMPRGSVLFSSRAPIGYIAIADGQVSTNQGFKSIVPFDNVGTAYVYYFLKENLSAIENVASGSTFKEVSGGTMKNFPAVIPDDDTLAKFKQFCSPLLEQQRALEYENRYLASLRDTLLPKLMNGEIDVSEVKI